MRQSDRVTEKVRESDEALPVLETKRGKFLLAKLLVKERNPCPPGFVYHQNKVNKAMIHRNETTRDEKGQNS